VILPTSITFFTSSALAVAYPKAITIIVTFALNLSAIRRNETRMAA